jgi:hypothetical protein
MSRTVVKTHNLRGGQYGVYNKYIHLQIQWIGRVPADTNTLSR